MKIEDIRQQELSVSVRVMADEVVENMTQLKILDDCIAGLCKVRDSVRVELTKSMGNWIIR